MHRPSRKHLLLSFIMIGLFILFPSVSGQSDYPTYVFNFIEIRVVPEDFSALQDIPIFSTNEELSTLLEDEETVFWEELGPTDKDLSLNQTFNSFAIVQVNETGIHQSVVALSTDNETLLWVESLDANLTNTFLEALNSTIQFFEDANKYWGLCEEIMLLPGHFNDLAAPFWRFAYHLIAESEKWILLVDLDGHLLHSALQDLPCQSCDLCYIPIILGVTGVLIISILFIYKRVLVKR